MKITLLALLLCTMQLNAQKLKSPLFKDKDRVCFIGNSITNNGEFYNFIYQYYATRFPEEQLSFFNCGISGDVAAGVLKRMNDDVLVHKPTWTVLMVGMNDVNRSLYIKAVAAKPGIEKKRSNALLTYKKNTDEIVTILKRQSKVILQKPTIYDQTATVKAENAFGVNDALDSCAMMVEQLSRKYDTRLVDYRTILTQANQVLQAKDASATIIGPDRIHPASPGHLLMAYAFLKQTGAPAYVSKMVLDNNAGSVKESLNCEITNVKKGKESLSFSALEYSLPFPVKPEAEEVLALVPFTKDLNQEILQVTKLAAGSYDLLIDNQKVASFTADELKSGVNLALLRTSPQYKQAMKVRALCINYRQNESLLRSLKFVEYGQLEELKGTTDTVQLKSFLTERLKKYLDGGHYSYYETQFKNYLLNKPKELATVQKLEQIKTKIYKANKPVIHQFNLVRTSNN